MKVKFCLKLGFREVVSDMCELPDNTTDADLQEAVKEWVLEKSDFWFEVINTKTEEKTE